MSRSAGRQRQRRDVSSLQGGDVSPVVQGPNACLLTAPIDSALTHPAAWVVPSKHFGAAGWRAIDAAGCPGWRARSEPFCKVLDYGKLSIRADHCRQRSSGVSTRPKTVSQRAPTTVCCTVRSCHSFAIILLGVDLALVRLNNRGVQYPAWATVRSSKRSCYGRRSRRSLRQTLTIRTDSRSLR